MRTAVSALIVALALVGCAHTREVRFKSEPAGARVEFNGGYIGKTPLTTFVTREVNDWSNVVYAAEVVATYKGCTITKKIPKGASTPGRMFFDFSGCKQGEQVGESTEED